MAMADPFDLDRFVRAQETTYAQALTEIRGGRKRSHWMWFVFPQIAGLGSSAMASAMPSGASRRHAHICSIRCSARASWSAANLPAR